MSGLTINLPAQNAGGFATHPGLRRWRAARAKVLFGSADAQIACVGDSETMGTGGSGTAYVNGAVYAYPRRLASALTSAGLPAAETSCFGDHRIGFTSFLTYDTRVLAPSAWVEFMADGPGGYYFFNNTDANALSFAPVPAFDNMILWDTTNSAYCAWGMNVDGGATIATLTPTGSTRLRRTVETCALATHTINIIKSGTLNLNLVFNGWDTFDSTTHRVRVHSLSGSGWQASQVVGAAGVNAPLPFYTSIAPDLFLIYLGTNEYVNNITPAAFTAAMQTLISACLVIGDVVLIAPAFASTAYPQVTQQAIINCCYALATQYSLPLLDLSKRFGLWVDGNASGMYYDVDHMSGAGYLDIAASISNILMQ